MSERIIAPKLRSGNQIRVIAPSFSASIFKPDLLHAAEDTLATLGLETSYGSHAFKIDAFRTSSVELRVADIHVAFEGSRCTRNHFCNRGLECKSAVAASRLRSNSSKSKDALRVF